jgi:murein DD-endopeptidase MepM/ murein hydrolase activator NlpD
MAPERHPADVDGIVEAMRAAADYHPETGRPPVVLSLPFRGTWLAQNSPGRRVPSHGTHFLGQSFAIDFVAVQRVGRGWRTAAVRDRHTLLGREPAERFFAFGQLILAPADARVVATHDGEPDHHARRSPLTLTSYAFTQRSRLRQGLNAITGNSVILALDENGPFVVLVHLRAGSLRVRVGDAVKSGQAIAACGNSGNSTQPHVHIQVMDSSNTMTGRGLPMAFRNYRVWHDPNRAAEIAQGIPGEREIVEPSAPA